MDAYSADRHDSDSLDLVEQLMSLEEEFGIEITEEDCEHWWNGEFPDDWLNGAPVPRQGPFPTLPDGAEAQPPVIEDPDSNERE